MRKTALFIIFAILIFSLSGCVVFQKVMDVSGSWVVELGDDSVIISQLRAFSEETNTPRATWLYAPLKLTQTGNQLSGKFYLYSFEVSVSGTISEDDTVEIEGVIPLLNSQREQTERPAETFVLSGKATGSKTLFNKQATKIDGKFYPKTDPEDYIEFEAIR